MTPIEDHLVAFLLANRGEAFLSYRRRCLALWEREYGPAVTAKVKAAVSAKWGKG